MVIGKERGSWYDPHPPACNCAACVDKRTADRQFEARRAGQKIGRNEQCPCGSGKKYKKCHGLATT